MRIVGVMGSGKESWSEFSIPLGKLIADSGCHLLTGGGNGVMNSVSAAFLGVTGRKGHTIGIVPTISSEDGAFLVKDGYPNPSIDIVIVSPLGTFTGEDPGQISRNHINILTSHLIVALPGSKGTLNEVQLAQKFKKPVVLYGPSAEFENFPEDIQRAETLEEVADFINKFSI